MGILWNCLGNSQGEWHGIVLCAIHWAVAHMHVMELQWCFSWGDAKEVLYGYFSGMSPWASHGIALGILHVNSMGLFFG